MERPMVVSNVQVTDAAERARAVVDGMRAVFVERDEEIAMLVLAYLAQEHAFVLGPPGTGKSMMLRALVHVASVPKEEAFEILVAKGTEPIEFFGPFSIAGMRDRDVYERKIAGYLPAARLAFVDEVWKGNSPTLNGLLGIMNERRFRNGTQIVDCPLETLVGASNEVPQDTTLAALYDRFLVRLSVDSVRDQDKLAELILLGGTPTPSVVFDPADVATLRRAIPAVDLRPVMQSLMEIRAALAREGLTASDRRWKAIAKLIRTRAILDGRLVAKASDLLVIAHTVWNEPKDRAVAVSKVAELSMPELHKALKLLDAAREQREKIDETKIATDPKVLANVGEANTAVGGMLDEIDRLTPSDEIKAIRDRIAGIYEELGRLGMAALRRRK